MMEEKEFSKKVKEIGGKAYVVGGWVRDRLMGRCPHDRDYVLCGLEEKTFAKAFPHAVKAGSSFPVFILTIDGEPCDVALARTEKKKGSGYKGFEVEYGPDVTIEEDLFRRDTTINSMALLPEEDKLIDPFGGQADIKAKMIRATSYHFCEDPVRALRAARQAAEFDFIIEKNTLEMMGRCGHELSKEPKERIFGELKRAMLCDRPSILFSMLADAAILGAVIPSLDELWKRQSENIGEDFNRAVSLLDRTAELSQRPEVRFASLVRSIALSLECTGGLLDYVGQTIRLPNIWRRCAEFASLHLPDPSEGKNAAVAVDTLAKLQNHPIGIDGCIAITNAEGTIGSYPFLENSALYLEVMRKARAELPAEIEGKARGEWIRARQVEAVSKL